MLLLLIFTHLGENHIHELAMIMRMMTNQSIAHRTLSVSLSLSLCLSVQFSV